MPVSLERGDGEASHMRAAIQPEMLRRDFAYFERAIFHARAALRRHSRGGSHGDVCSTIKDDGEHDLLRHYRTPRRDVQRGTQALGNPPYCTGNRPGVVFSHSFPKYLKRRWVLSYRFSSTRPPRVSRRIMWKRTSIAHAPTLPLPPRSQKTNPTHV